MVLTLYHYPISSPSRGALLAARVIGVDVTIEIVDLFAKEQLKPEFIKINPQHVVPTLVDGDFILWESRAISAYLADKYSKDDNLYPKDPQKRALVDQRLYFDCCTLLPRLRAIAHPVLFNGQDEVYDEQKLSIEEALGFLDVFLEGNNFVAGDKLTIADCSLVATTSSIVSLGWDISSYGNVKSWLTRCSLEIPDFKDSNQAGADLYGKAIKSRLASGKI